MGLFASLYKWRCVLCGPEAEVEHTAVANDVQYLVQQYLGHGVFFSTHHLKSGGS